MNMQIITAHMEQYRAVRDNAIDALREFVANGEHSLEDKWTMYSNYHELVEGKVDYKYILSAKLDAEEKESILNDFIAKI